MIGDGTKTIDLANARLDAETIIADYRLAYESRQASLIGRREVMSGKAKFGIFGDGKEVAQLAQAKAWRMGDFRSGYYRDQTLMLALGVMTLHEFFAQLYAHADPAHEPMTGGRQMNAHFATPLLEPDGSWKDLTAQYNSSADVSPTGSQMPRLVGLAYASRLYRELDALSDDGRFSEDGREVAFGNIGNATCAEGMFWEAVNAIGVLGAPAVISIWDDAYGISVPNEYQVTKENLSALLEGFRRAPESDQGFDLYTVRGWDYPALVDAYLRAGETARREHMPAIIHVTELTQPQGHSTSGSHERYKTAERLAWEEEHDALRKMRDWMIHHGIADDAELDALEDEARARVEQVREEAYAAFTAPLREERDEVVALLEDIGARTGKAEALAEIQSRLEGQAVPLREDVMGGVVDALLALRDVPADEKQALVDWKRRSTVENRERYGSHLYSQSERSALHVSEVEPVYGPDAPEVNGWEVMNACFDAALARDPRVIAFGEDVGRIGDVNQGMRGMQEQYGELRVSDTGIRECTILGQAIGMAMRGLRPIAEIQYLDYLLYALQIMSDDLATVHWRTKGGQKAPVIVRTRGHRLEGVWHAGSPMAGVIHLVRGMHVLVPRDMTRAAGFYNTLLQSDEPGLIVEVLNGYRLKERLPDNIGQLTVPVGQVDVVRAGDDVTVVTYGAMVRIVLEAAERLAAVDIDVEVIDVQSLLPFDLAGDIARSLRKTGRVLFADEDVPGGTTAYMLQEVIEGQRGYYWLDSEPRTLSASAHRPAYGSDGDYWSKPSADDVVEAVYDMMNEVDPRRYPALEG